VVKSSHLLYSVSLFISKLYWFIKNGEENYLVKPGRLAVVTQQTVIILLDIKIHELGGSGGSQHVAYSHAASNDDCQVACRGISNLNDSNFEGTISVLTKEMIVTHWQMKRLVKIR
jgi:hypothetical protein